MPDTHEQDPAPPARADAGQRLSRLAPEILARWEHLIRVEVPEVGGHSSPVLRNSVPEFLRRLADALCDEHGVNPQLEVDAAVEHGEQRAALPGYTLERVLQEYLLLRRTVLQTLEAESPLTPDVRGLLNEAIDLAIGAAVSRYVQVTKKRIGDAEEQYRLLVENAADYAIFVLDPKGRVRTWNPGAQRITGYLADEILGQDARVLFTVADQERGVPEYELTTAARDGRAEDERWHVRKDGRLFFASGVMIPLRDGELRGFAKIMRDVTAHRRAEEERALLLEREQQRNERLQLLSATASQLLLNERPEIFIQSVYERLAAHLNLHVYVNYLVPAEGDALRLACYAGLSPEVAALWERQEFGRPQPPERAPTGDTVAVDDIQLSREPGLRLARDCGLTACVRHPLIAGDQLLGVLIFGSRTRTTFEADELALMRTVCDQVALALETARMIEELQRRAEALSEADRRKDEFLAMLGHELRNPLAGIANAIYILDQATPSDPQKDRLRAIIGRQTAHLARLVEDLLDVSRISQEKIELRKQPVDLTAIARQAIEASRPIVGAKSHTVSCAWPEGPVIVAADPTRLEQVITNLLHNAAKYTEPHGEIRVAVEAEGENAVLHVRDTGIGIAPDLLPHVFDLFRQADRALDRSEGGLGIGLTLVKQLVHLHGGSVEAHSEGLGTGAEFLVRLPLVPSGSLTTAIDARSEPSASLDRMRVLVVEDYADASATLADVLELWGAEVRVASSGPDGLEAALETRPNVVLIDIGLPGMDGYEVARRLRARADGPRPLLIALTGYGREDDRRRAFACGFDHHLTKPVDADALRALLATGLTKAATN